MKPKGKNGETWKRIVINWMKFTLLISGLQVRWECRTLMWPSSQTSSSVADWCVGEGELTTG